MHAYIHVTYPTNRMLKHSPSADAKKTTKRFLFFLRRNICWPPRPKGLDQNSFWLGQLGTQHDILRKMTGATWNQLGWKKMKKVDPIAGWVFRHSGRDMQICIQKRQYCTVPLDFWDPLILYIYILITWVVAIEISRTCTECLRAQSLCLFFISNQCATHYTCKVSCKLDISLPKHPGKMMSQQMLSQPVAGCETFGRSWCSRWDLNNVEDVFFQGVLPPPFPCGTVARTREPPKHFLVITNCFASIDSWFDIQQYDAGIVFSSLSLVVPYSCFSCPLRGRCCCCCCCCCSAPSYCPLAYFIGILPHPFACEFSTCRGSRMSGTKMLKYMQTHPHPE